MFGALLSALEDPEVCGRLLSSLDAPEVSARLARVAQAEGRPAADVMASRIWNFLDTASDDHFVQLMGIMNQARDPGLAAVRAILAATLPEEVA
ncbi:hypothetical protein GCM10007301_09800 [Azorhizobium oxalatiphilum]|uniref:Uncharacterized protein n=1 Tax=Azorhizobium oxalatiphilum TaxID=980631 RepID=A0A917BQ14_9HYPH|nr:hypothetical protein [Azorhizobium oxalatiphilum]GGF52345.1 hypothetical protein GCM10007301_09800 [Azorhizobium oxalatiphilum]